MFGWGEKKENKRIKALEEGLAKALTDLHALDVDMHLLWDKVRVALGRISKRSAIIEKTETQPATEESSDQPSSGYLPGVRWNSHQIEEQNRILKRRAGL